MYHSRKTILMWITSLLLLFTVVCGMPFDEAIKNLSDEARGSARVTRRSTWGGDSFIGKEVDRCCEKGYDCCERLMPACCLFDLQCCYDSIDRLKDCCMAGTPKSEKCCRQLIFLHDTCYGHETGGRKMHCWIYMSRTCAKNKMLQENLVCNKRYTWDVVQ
ncbi:uncharacterized protein LOC106179133 [Lingula anatina]|uniref:Uncharacterized protein LOC106179133 n=1 Tax=Lingula anatina TaxID=7574 RepID=A0A1S3K6J5_LINAN|nr:uncharacterized protein LOC106179133 [Lingula anatina]|eukprot:XP_013418122.1 uncharacterized protein LOC106179133 [Lingula anatina]